MQWSLLPRGARCRGVEIDVGLFVRIRSSVLGCSLSLCLVGSCVICVRKLSEMQFIKCSSGVVVSGGD